MPPLILVLIVVTVVQSPMMRAVPMWMLPRCGGMTGINLTRSLKGWFARPSIYLIHSEVFGMLFLLCIRLLSLSLFIFCHIGLLLEDVSREGRWVSYNHIDYYEHQQQLLYINYLVCCTHFVKQGSDDALPFLWNTLVVGLWMECDILAGFPFFSRPCAGVWIF